MTIAHVQSFSANPSGSGTSWSITVPAIGVGDSVVFVLTTGGALLSSVTDNAVGVSNTYVIQGTGTYTPFGVKEILVTGVGITGSPTQLHFTFASALSGAPGFYGDEYSGRNLTVDTVVVPVYIGGTASPISINITPINPNCLIWGYFHSDATTFGAGSGFTIRVATDPGTEDLQQSTAAPIAVSFTQSGATQGPVLGAVALFESLIHPPEQLTAYVGVSISVGT